MPVLQSQLINKLSQVEIDSDLDMKGYNIKNVKEIILDTDTKLYRSNTKELMIEESILTKKLLMKINENKYPVIYVDESGYISLAYIDLLKTSLIPDIDNQYILGSSLYRFYSLYLGTCLFMQGERCTSSGQYKDSSYIDLNGTFWDSKTIRLNHLELRVEGSFNYTARLYMHMVSDYPDGYLTLWIGEFIDPNMSPRQAPVEIMRWHRNYVHFLRPLTFEAGVHDLIVNRGATAESPVTSTTETVIHQVTKKRNYIYYIETIHVIAKNPTGSGTTLHFKVRLVFHDNTYKDIFIYDLAEGQEFNDWLHYIMEHVDDGKLINSVQLLAYVDVTPPTGYEPVVQLERVVGNEC